MKKIMFVKVLLIFAFTIVSCTREETSYTKETLNANSVLSLGKNGYNFGETNKRGGGVGFAFDLGRKNAKPDQGLCPGFGICKLRAFWITIIWSSDEIRDDFNYTGIITTKISDETKFAAYILFDSFVDTEDIDTDFYVDEDILISTEDAEYIIKSGAYELMPALGEFGGYELAVDRIE